MSDLFYINEDGNNVHTAQFLKNRGSCCKTNCLHCPYGTTLKNFPLTFEPIKLEEIAESQSIIDSVSGGGGGVASDLLDSAFGGKKENKITKFNFDQYFFFSLKEQRCGVIHKGRLQLKKVFLKEHFREQGLDLPTVQTQFSPSAP